MHGPKSSAPPDHRHAPRFLALSPVPEVLLALSIYTIYYISIYLFPLTLVSAIFSVFSPHTPTLPTHTLPHSHTHIHTPTTHAHTLALCTGDTGTTGTKRR